jgi:hypothetical protein
MLEVQPPDAGGPYDVYGTFTFGALNVFANAPVVVDIVSALRRHRVEHPVLPRSTAHLARLVPELDWPIELGEVPVDALGAVTEGYAPAGVPLFEQLRGPDDAVPLTGGPYPDGAAHVAGLNFGVPGGFALCVGCHAGHSQMTPVFDYAKSGFTNLAPGAIVTVSSSRDPARDGAIVDRRAWKGDIHDAWTTAPGQSAGEWARLDFRVPITVQSVRLWDMRPDAASSLHVEEATVELLLGDTLVATSPSGAWSATGTEVVLPEPIADAVRVTFQSVTGAFDGAIAPGVAEIRCSGRASRSLPATPPRHRGRPRAGALDRRRFPWTRHLRPSSARARSTRIWMATSTVPVGGAPAAPPRLWRAAPPFAAAQFRRSTRPSWA